MHLFHLFIFLLYLCTGISPFTAFFQDIVGKNYAFNHGKTKRATLQKRNVNLANKNEM